MFSLSDVWQAFLGFCIRFWDSKSQPEQNETIYLLKLESERNHQMMLKLLESVTAGIHQVEPEVQSELPKPIGQLNWKAQAAKLTRESIEKRRQLEAEAKAGLMTEIKTLEQETGVNQ